MAAMLDLLQSFETDSEKVHADELLKAGKYDEALRIAESLQQKFPSLPGVGLLFSQIYMKAGDLDSAEIWSRRTIELADQMVSALRSELASMPAASADDVVEQCAAYRAEELSVLRQRDMSQFGLAIVMANRGDDASATALLERFITERPHSVFLRVRLGEIYCGMGRIDDAKALCRACLDIEVLAALPDEWNDVASLCAELGIEEKIQTDAAWAAVLSSDIPPF